MGWTRRDVGLSLTLGLGTLALPAFAQPAETRRRLGVQTHFAQGRSPDLLQQLQRQGLPFDFVRDEIYWERLEVRPGTYDWSYCDGYVDAVARAGRRLMLMVDWSNRLYRSPETSLKRHPHNGIFMPETDRERDAFAQYVLAVLNRYAHPGGERYRPGLFEAIEVWNEANGSWTGDMPVRTGPDGVPAALVALTRAVHQAVRRVAAFNSIPILGGACIKIPTNFINWMLEAGLAEVVDGLAVHPYMSPEETLVSAAALRRRLDQDGHQRLSIWATEFGNSKSPGDLVKTLAAICASPFAGSSYYLAQTVHPGDSGLLDQGGRLTPVGQAYRAWAADLEKANFIGRLPSQPKTYLLHFGRPGAPGLVVAWSRWGRTRLVVPPSSKVFDALKRPRPGGTVELGEEPIVIIGEGDIRETVSEGECIADSFADFSPSKPSGVWSYVGRLGGGAAQPLQVRSDMYEDYYGFPQAGQARLDAGAAHPGREGAQPFVVIRRYTAPRAMSGVVAGRIVRASGKGDGTGVAVTTNSGQPVLPRRVLRDTQPLLFNQPVRLEAGESLDFATDPGDGVDLNFDGVGWDVALYRR